MIDKNIIIVLTIILIGYLLRRKENFEMRYQNCDNEDPKFHCDLDKEKVIYPPPDNVRYNRFQVPENAQAGLGLECCDGYWR